VVGNTSAVWLLSDSNSTERIERFGGCNEPLQCSRMAALGGASPQGGPLQELVGALAGDSATDLQDHVRPQSRPGLPVQQQAVQVTHHGPTFPLHGPHG